MTDEREHENSTVPTEIRTRPRVVALSADAPESDHHTCAERRMKATFPDRQVPREVALAVTQRCYLLPAGGRTKLHISFMDGKERLRPKGTLVVEPKRGKVSPSRIELDGSTDHVEIDYTAPDETIRVSVRAFLAGFGRGKIHLHLE
jgi:hypothetical protein